MAKIEDGDRLRGYGAWEKDLYGFGTVLSGKRKTRGWNGDAFRRDVLESFGEQSRIRRTIEVLMDWSGGKDGRGLWKGRAPWEGL